MLLLLFSLSLSLFYASAFYIVNESPMVYSGNDPSFGRSIFIQKDNNQQQQNFKIYVGSPFETSTFNSYNRSGTIYTCNVKEQTCIETNIEDDFLIDNGRFGATISGGKDSLMVCAPNYFEKFNGTGKLFGRCVVQNNNNSFKKVDFDLKQSDYLHQFGFSSAYANNSTYFVGAPAIDNFKGGVAKVNTLDNITVNLFVSNISMDESYAGYDVLYEKFGDDNLMVVGIPRYDYYGQVQLFNKEAKFLSAIDSKKLGEYFGAVLGTANLYGNGNNLLVGAPMFSRYTHDEGQVYVYEVSEGRKTSQLAILNGNINKEKKWQYKQRKNWCLGRREIGSRFGSAIANLGPFSKNKLYDAVAISAPYEDEGRGAIYIYIGSKNGPICSQRILGEKVSPSIKNFGLSLSNSFDIDNNGFKDLAIGSAGKFVLLKSKPVVKLQGNLITPNLLNVETTNFSIEICINFSPELSAIESVNVTLSLKFSQNISTKDLNINLNLKSNENHCQNETVNLRGTNIKPLLIQYEYELSDDCNECPVTNPEDDNKREYEINFASNCSKDGKNVTCKHNVQAEASFNETNIVIGEIDKVLLSVYLTNDGDPAYKTEIHFTLPHDVKVLKCPSNCSCRNKNFSCNIANPLRGSKIFNILLYLNDISTRFTSLEIPIEISVLDEKVKRINASLKLSVKHNLNLSSMEPKQVIMQRDDKILFLNHNYYLANNGPSPLENYHLLIKVPQITNKNGSQILSVEDKLNEHLRCDKNSVENIIMDYTKIQLPKSQEEIIFINDERVKYITCNYTGKERLNKGQGDTIEVKIRVNKDLLMEYYKKEISTKDIFVTFSQAFINNDNEELLTMSYAYLHTVSQFSIQWWVYFVGVTSGIILLLILAFVLYKCGYFMRKKDKAMLVKAQVGRHEVEPLNR